MHDSLLTHLIAVDPVLHLRLAALVEKRLATPGNVTPTEAEVYNPPPVEALAVAVAVNPSIFATVKGALDPAAPDVGRAVDAVTDSDLDYVVVSALPSLG